MSLATQIKMELNQLGIKPKKSLGQSFLINEGIYRKIIAATEIQKGDRVVEVGPGLGTLTQYFLDADAEVIAIEKDYKLAYFLKNKFANSKNVRIVEDDILKFNSGRLNLLLEVQPLKYYKLVGNIPFYLTSHLLRTIFEKWPQPELIVLMLQKEVAQRITAKPPKMSLLAVLVQYYAHPKIINYVSKNSFWPAPEVDSAIIKIVPSEQFTAYSKNTVNCKLKTENFFKIVRTGFAGKRKQLGNNLARGLKLPKNIVEEKLKSISIDPKRRAETLTLGEWQNIATMLLPR